MHPDAEGKQLNHVSDEKKRNTLVSNERTQPDPSRETTLNPVDIHVLHIYALELLVLLFMNSTFMKQKICTCSKHEFTIKIEENTINSKQNLHHPQTEFEYL
ncbi:unnamed protein product [Urochloa humidicola]